MEAYKIETTVAEDGSLSLKDLPFRAGAGVEVILLERDTHRPEVEQTPLWGTVVEYIDPFEPVGVDDWEVLK